MRRLLLGLSLALCALRADAALTGAAGKLNAVPCRGGTHISCRQSNNSLTRLTGALMSIFDAQLGTVAALTNHQVEELQLGWSDLHCYPSATSCTGSCNTSQTGPVVNGMQTYYCWDPLLAAASTVFQAGTGHFIQLDFVITPTHGVPGWMTSSGAQYVNGQIVPWDATYLSTYGTFLTALAAEITSMEGAGSHSPVLSITVSVPVGEMNIIGTELVGGVETFCGGTTQPPASCSGGITYSRSSYLSAWETMITDHCSAFSSLKMNMLISAPTEGQIAGPSTDYTFYPAVVTYAQTACKGPARFAADLGAGYYNGAPSQRMGDYVPGGAGGSLQGDLTLAYQMVCHYTADSSSSCPAPFGTFPQNILRAVCTAWDQGAFYVGIYKADVLYLSGTGSITVQQAVTSNNNLAYCNPP